jgi:hypothetical protein
MHEGIENILSVERFATYLAWAQGDRERAIELYTLNTQLSEALYTPLQMLEVALRNCVHDVMTEVFGPNWFDLPEHQLNEWQSDMLDKARKDLADASKVETPSALVAALTFGYWTAMLGAEYEDLWQMVLHKIAKNENGKGLRRKDLTKPSGPVRTLRNRIAHHEPILYRNLPKHHNAILQLTKWLSPVAAEWCRSIDRFDRLYPQGGLLLPSPTTDEALTPDARPLD